MNQNSYYMFDIVIIFTIKDSNDKYSAYLILIGLIQSCSLNLHILYQKSKTILMKLHFLFRLCYSFEVPESRRWLIHERIGVGNI